MELQVLYYHSPVGPLQIKVSANAIHAVLFVNSWKGPQLAAGEIHSDTDSALLFPVAAECVTQLQEYFTGIRRRFELPLIQEGTAFQQKVWTALLNIPYGKTISYMQLSKRIGDVKAIRAVGTTNGKNSISIIVPCHRVIGADGSLTGYGGDLWRKKWLLDHENKWANGVQELF